MSARQKGLRKRIGISLPFSFLQGFTKAMVQQQKVQNTVMALISTHEYKKPPTTPVLILTHKGVDMVWYSQVQKAGLGKPLLAQIAPLPASSGVHLLLVDCVHREETAPPRTAPPRSSPSRIPTQLHLSSSYQEILT